MSQSKFIVLDDDYISGYLTTEILLDHDPENEVLLFNNVASCFEFIEKCDDDYIVLADINMPDINGWEFLKDFRERGFRKNIILLTASINEDDLVRARKNGAGFLNKPLVVGELMNELNELTIGVENDGK
jgi:CheY-like chemotaxis protein